MRRKFMLINRACKLKGQSNVDINGMCTGHWYKLGFHFSFAGLHHPLHFDFGKSKKKSQVSETASRM